MGCIAEPCFAINPSGMLVMMCGDGAKSDVGKFQIMHTVGSICTGSSFCHTICAPGCHKAWQCAHAQPNGKKALTVILLRTLCCCSSLSTDTLPVAACVLSSCTLAVCVSTADDCKQQHVGMMQVEPRKGTGARALCAGSLTARCDLLIRRDIAAPHSKIYCFNLNGSCLYITRHCCKASAPQICDNCMRMVKRVARRC